MLTARAGGLLALAVLLAGASAAWGHANFVRSDPPANQRLDSPPTTVRVWFSEAAEPRFSSLEVLDGAGNRVDRGGTHAVPGDPAALEISLRPLAQGLYVVAWEAVSAVDGHVTRGNFALAVRIAPPVVLRSGDTQELSAYVFLGAAVRWAAYLAGAALVGPLAVWLFVLGGIRSRGDMVPVRQLHGIAWIGLIIAAIAALTLQIAAVDRSGIIGTVNQLLFHTRYGEVWIARIALLAAMIPLQRRLGRGRSAWGPLVIGEGVLLTTSLNSHSAASGSSLALLADWLHISAVSVWIGGLLGLVLIVRDAAARLPDTERWRFLARIIPRFSILAAICVGTIIATGSYLLWLHAGSVEAIIETWYGRDLFAKLVLVAPLLLLGALNLLVIRPRLARAAEGPDGSASALGTRFGRAVRGEAVLAILVLMLTGILSSLPPARQTYAQIVAQGPLKMSLRAEDLRIIATIDPGRVGPNLVILNIAGPQGPVDDAERVDARLTYRDRQMGTAIEATIPHGGGQYIAHEPVLGLAGHWQLEVLVRRRQRDDVVADFRFSVTRSSAMSETPASPLAEYPLATFAFPLGIAALAIVAILALTRTYV